MPDGPSASEVGRQIGEHAKHADPHERRDRLISITEAVLLSIVALLAAWSGYAAAKWSTQAQVELATASSLHIDAYRADADTAELRRLVRLRVLVRRLHREEQGRHAAGGTPIPARLQGRLRRPARDEAGDEPPSAAGARGRRDVWKIANARAVLCNIGLAKRAGDEHIYDRRTHVAPSRQCGSARIGCRHRPFGMSARR